MDWKLSSSTGLADLSRQHLEFLEVALKKEVFIKTVICQSTNEGDLKNTARMISDIDKDIPLVLQPNHYELGHSLTKKIIELQQLCLKYLSDVRVIPQMHKILGVK